MWCVQASPPQAGRYQLRLQLASLWYVINIDKQYCVNGSNIFWCLFVPLLQAIYAEGKEHAMAIGLTLMSTAEIVSVNKGVAVESKHFMNDGLWHITRLL